MWTNNNIDSSFDHRKKAGVTKDDKRSMNSGMKRQPINDRYNTNKTYIGVFDVNNHEIVTKRIKIEAVQWVISHSIRGGRVAFYIDSSLAFGFVITIYSTFFYCQHGEETYKIDIFQNLVASGIAH